MVGLSLKELLITFQNNMQTTITQEVFSVDRLKSLLWRLGAVAVVAILSYLQTNITQLQIPAQYVVFAGLVLGEITKAVNNYLNQQ